ncbi:MAG: hypothetical protein M1832_000435 [Thelocarpon impressellum]|nr:MAG: hypothetical protein M1832_000435 [Thelocarpon impressellum]
MHFALPPRKTSQPPPYAARQTSRATLLRRRRLQGLGVLACGAVALLFLLSRAYRSGPPPVPAGTPEVVMVTPLEEARFGQDYVAKIKQNRVDYAERHGYATFFPAATDYDLAGAPSGWARVAAVRHAMTLHPHSTYFFHLDQTALLMNPALTVQEHLMDRRRLEKLMLRDTPVVPPDSVIKTFSHLRGDRIDFVLTQDGEGLSQRSFVIRQGPWARFFLDTWFDPLYRSYNFQKAEGHALEHIVQWHSTILAKLALIPQRTMNSYSERPGVPAEPATLFAKGDFVVSLHGCDDDPARSCEEELRPFWALWKQTARRME